MMLSGGIPQRQQLAPIRQDDRIEEPAGPTFGVHRQRLNIVDVGEQPDFESHHFGCPILQLRCSTGDHECGLTNEICIAG